jgi:hypothetical protein
MFLQQGGQLHERSPATAFTSTSVAVLRVRVLQSDGIEGEDRLLNEIQRDACGIAGLFEVETPIKRIDQGE